MGVYFNEDCNHFIYTRARDGIAVGEKELRDFILQYKGSGITDFFINVSGSTGWYPCKSRDNALGNYHRAVADGRIGSTIDPRNAKYVELLCDIYERQGLPMHKIWVDTLREIGINPWISIRTNDVHNNDDESNYLHSSFFREHKNLRRGAHHGACEYFDNALDFYCPEVREHLFELVCEVLGDFDMYGLEMDWMREIYSLRIGKELEGTQIMTEFMRRVKAEVKKAEGKWGHPIQLGVRMPADPLLALRLGFDIIEWINEGLIDLVVPTGRWATTDNDMPIDFWKRIIGDKPVKLVAGLEILVDSMFTEPDKKVMYQSVESARGSAAEYLAMGVDGVYLFNFMDDPTHKITITDFFDDDKYIKTIREMSSLERLGDLPRRHIVTYCDIRVPGIPHKNPLPLECGLRGSGNPYFVGKPEYKTLRIPTGIIPKGARAALVIGVDKTRKAEGSDFIVFLNAEKLNFSGKVELPKPAYPDLEFFRFGIENADRLPIADIVEIAAAKEPFTVKWAEIDVNFDC